MCHADRYTCNVWRPGLVSTCSLTSRARGNATPQINEKYLEVITYRLWHWSKSMFWTKRFTCWAFSEVSVTNPHCWIVFFHPCNYSLLKWHLIAFFCFIPNCNFSVFLWKSKCWTVYTRNRMIRLKAKNIMGFCFGERSISLASQASQ